MVGIVLIIFIVLLLIFVFFIDRAYKRDKAEEEKKTMEKILESLGIKKFGR